MLRETYYPTRLLYKFNCIYSSQFIKDIYGKIITSLLCKRDNSRYRKIKLKLFYGLLIFGEIKKYNLAGTVLIILNIFTVKLTLK